MLFLAPLLAVAVSLGRAAPDPPDFKAMSRQELRQYRRSILDRLDHETSETGRQTLFDRLEDVHERLVEVMSPKELKEYSSAIEKRIDRETDEEKQEVLVEHLLHVDDVLDEHGLQRTGPLSAAAQNAAQRAAAKKPDAAGPETAKEAIKNDLAKGKFASALERSSAMANKHPNDPKFREFSSLAKSALGDKAGALADARKALGLKPGDARLRSLVAALQAGQVPGSIRGAKTPGFGERGDDGLKPGAATTLRLASSPTRGDQAKAPPSVTSGYDERAESFTRQGAQRLKLGDFGAAERYASLALGSQPGSPRAHLLRGQALNGLGKADAAASEASAALDKDLDSALDALIEKAWSEMKKEEYEEAKKDALAAKRLKPASPKLESLEALLGRPAPVSSKDAAHPGPGGLGEIPEFFSGISAQSLAYARQAKAALALGDLKEALRLADLALKVDPRNHFALIVRAAASAARGNYDEAIRDASLALRLEPVAIDALLARSAAFAKLGDWAQSEQDADAALRLDPGLAEAYRLRGQARGKLGDAEGMKADEEQARLLESSAPRSAPPGPRKGLLWAALALGALLAGMGAAKVLARR